MTDEHITYSGAWGAVIIMTVIASWFLYRYLAPRNWREWSGAGVVQAFVIALYAEMYGFPLTIYLLVRFFGLDRRQVSTNLWSTLLGPGETGMLIAMYIGYGIAFCGILLLVRGWREVYRARRENRLVTHGLYAFVRHPQYLGLFIILFGEGIVHWPTIFSVILFPVIVGVYYFLARKEERTMLAGFGDEYRAYMERTPMFIPRFGWWRSLTGASEGE
ncbi:MAG: isoprenylcysteine carboxylmethyltransferase family protein [Deltaproteobacteria bacterium]|nr:isoprenylcysteine carboxylmethyltransferase family protein [Deltaproteobacteria bacterium]